MLLAGWGAGLLLRFAPDDLPRIHEVRVDGRVLAFTFAVSLVTGILFGLVPALAASNPDLNETLKEGGRGGTGAAKRKRLRNAFVIAEITLALVLLVGAGLMLKSFWRLQRIDPGFNPDGVLTMRMMLPFEIYQKPPQGGAFYTSAGALTVSARRRSRQRDLVRPAHAGRQLGHNQRRELRGRAKRSARRSRMALGHAGLLQGDGHNANGRARLHRSRRGGRAAGCSR